MLPRLPHGLVQYPVDGGALAGEAMGLQDRWEIAAVGTRGRGHCGREAFLSGEWGSGAQAKGQHCPGHCLRHLLGHLFYDCAQVPFAGCIDLVDAFRRKVASGSVREIRRAGSLVKQKSTRE